MGKCTSGGRTQKLAFQQSFYYLFYLPNRQGPMLATQIPIVHCPVITTRTVLPVLNSEINSLLSSFFPQNRFQLATTTPRYRPLLMRFINQLCNTYVILDLCHQIQTSLSMYVLITTRFCLLLFINDQVFIKYG